ncbi:restriction endonuclease subunit S [Chryseobacterium sp. SN22]|uniref:restriction endonuclease subunit S n=1 Tax=Chryseobacterium sp. SN22 TaxID=2606431 RepID=UPI001E412FC8|nr:restriction endonuclease subunit S [Chryseobacterium sp. SN22]
MEQINKLIPELRFPEFMYDGEWDNNILGKISDKITTGKLDANAMSENGKYRFYTCAKNYYKINEYAFDTEALLIAGNGAYLGYIHYYKGKFNAYQRTYVLSDFSKDVVYLKYYLEKNLPARIASEKKEGNTPYIVLSTIYEMTILFPKTEKEQQKIADCLTSLDELITAHKDKLEVLKNHKKGLLQNLFPQEGQKVPNYRFPEFVNDEEWEEQELNILGKLINGLTYSPDDIRKNGLLVLRSSNIQDGLIDLNDSVFVRADIKGAHYSQPNDILICVRNGSKALIGKNAIIPDGLPKSTHGAFMSVFRAENPSFAFQLFQTTSYEKQVNGDLGATINSINGKNFLKYVFFIPKNPKEQKKIAETLSAVDNLIIARTKKIEQLKIHKKGLMQGLFPKINA